MPTELEAKIKIDDPDAIRQKARAIGLEAEGEIFERNRLFDTAEGKLLASGSAIRLREEFPTDGGETRVVLTFKGPRQKSRFKMRAEWNVDVSDAEAMTAILEAAGFRETFYYEKRRQMWRDGACEVTLDEMPFLGWFVEVEGPSEEAIGETVARIGLADSQVIAKGYVHLLAKHLKQAGQDPSRAAFDNEGARE